MWQAQKLNKEIFETIYFHALKTSAELAAEDGAYETYAGCPISKGVLQPDMWNEKPSGRWDWDALRTLIAQNGVRNSLLVAPMPTASTSQILGNNECFEPYTSNIYSRRVLRYRSNKTGIYSEFYAHRVACNGKWMTRTVINVCFYWQWGVRGREQASSQRLDKHGPLDPGFEEPSHLSQRLHPAA